MPADTDADIGADPRAAQIAHWLRGELRLNITRLAPASNDASFRRYFRAWRADGATRVVMDAPPDKEDTAPFLKVAALLGGCGVHVPRIEAVDAARGFVLLEDLGSSSYLAQLSGGADPQALYDDALAALQRIAVQGLAGARELPPYDRTALEREMALMPEWFCERHLHLALDAADRGVLAATFELLAREALAQPVVFVHRDYHSRNLMWLPERNPGILDFQDAVRGPITYDLVSLLKDCYIDWPRARVEGWVADHRARLAVRGSHHPGGHLSASIGVATCRPDYFDSIEGLLARADQAMRQAKRDGRDRVVTAIPKT